MISKKKEKEIVIALREKGFSYREILKKTAVAKSTLSLWLRSVELSKRQKQRITQKRIAAGLRGAEAQKNKRQNITREIKEKAKAEIADISIDKKHLWLMGTMLYWAEGKKEKENCPASMVRFSNSDPFMIKLFRKWLIDVCKVSLHDIKYELYIHENSLNNLTIVKKYWSDFLGEGLDRFPTVYFKKNKIKTNRKRIGREYYGLLAIGVRKSTFLNRKIMGWIEGINEKFCRVD